MDLAKMNRMLEKFWWAMAIVTLIGVFVMTMIDGFDSWALWWCLPFICIILAFVRRFAAKRLGASQIIRDAAKAKAQRE